MTPPNQHLNQMSKKDIDRIIGEIRKKLDYRFFVENEWMYFLHKGILNCVSIHKENEVYHFRFDNRWIQIDCRTGNCIIVDLDRNCIEYFCVRSFLRTATQNKQYYFLYQLLIREKINRINGKNTPSVRLFFKMNKLWCQIERVGEHSLKPYTDCLSISEMLRGINEFIFKQVSSSFIRSNCLSIRDASSLNQLRLERLSLNRVYGIGWLLRGENKHLQSGSLSMITHIMLGFLGKKTGVSVKRIAHVLMKKASAIICDVVRHGFIKKIQNDLNGATREMDTLIKNNPIKTNDLSSKCSPSLTSIPECVSEMLDMSKERSLEKVAKRLYLEKKKQDKLDKQEELRTRQMSIKEFQEGIEAMEAMDESIRYVQQRISVLDEDEIASRECAMRLEIGKKRKPWDEFVEESEEDEETNSFGKRTRRFK